MMELKGQPPDKSQIKLEKKLFKTIVILIIIIIMIYLNVKAFPIFLSMIEISNVILAISISIVVLNTYGLSKGREFPLLGIAYIFISIFLFLHAIIMSSEHQLNVTSTVMLIIALYMESGTFLVKGILLEKKINIYLCGMTYSFLSIILLFEVFKWKFFLNSIISETGMYYFNKGSLHIIGTVFAISTVIFYKKRKCLDRKIFQYIITALLFKTLSAFILSFILVDESNNFMALIGYFSAIGSFYLLYQGIVIANLKKPYARINMQNDTLRAILESTADGILVVDDLGKILHYNENFAKMWRIPTHLLERKEDRELLNFVRDQLLYPDDFIRQLEKVVKYPKDETNTIPFKDGRVYDRFSKPLIINGLMSGRVWGFRDITEHVNMIETLRIKEKIIDTSLNAIVYTDMEGKITYANPSFLDLHGYSGLEEVKNVNGIDFSAEPNIDVKIGDRLLEDGKWFGEVKGKRKDQSEFYAECFANMIYDKEGKPIYAVVFLNDISLRKETEKQVKKNEALYRRLIEILPDAVFVNKQEKVVMTNKQGLKLSGYDDYQDIEDACYNDIIKVHPDYMEAVEERLNKLKKEETTVDFLERKLIVKEDTIIDAEVAAVSFQHDEEYYMVTVVRDISERKKVEKLQQQTLLFSNISHELKTPLNIILGSIQLLHNLHEEFQECAFYNKYNKYLWIMKQNCYRLLRLMNNLIDLTKADNGFLKLNLATYNIIDVVESITQSVADYASTKNISLIFDTDIEEKMLIFDPDKMERILLNLLSNAIKFTEKGGSIAVTVQECENTIEISVKDTGIGIPEEQLQEIFDRFKQVNSTLHRKNEGSGIGLSLVKALVETHGGKISAKSILGQGSEFIIKLPSGLNQESITQYDEAAGVLTREVNIEKISVEFSDIYSVSV